jgi:hypothetical protein
MQVGERRSHENLSNYDGVVKQPIARVNRASPSTDAYVHPDAARMAAVRRILENYLVVEDIYPGIADRFVAHGVTRFAEIGGGRGPVSEILRAAGVDAFVVDK